MTNASDTGGFGYAFFGDTPRDTMIGLGLLALALAGGALAYTGLYVIAHAASGAEVMGGAIMAMLGAGAAKVGLTTGF